MDEKAFTVEFCKYLKSKFQDIKVEYIKELEVRYKIAGKEEITALLYNAYTEYRIDPSEINSIFEKSIVWVNDKNKKTMENIVPIIKGKRFYMEIQDLKFGKDLYFEKLNEELYIYYAFDNEHHISYVKIEDLKKLEISSNEIRDVAIDNLITLVPQIKRIDFDGFFIITANGIYESSLILLDDIWTKENFPVKGDFVIAIPAREVLLITGTQEEKGLKILKEKYLNDDMEYSYFITKEMFVLRNSRWEVY
ncbi:DUF1444 family protein [Lutibacter sp.]